MFLNFEFISAALQLLEIAEDSDKKNWLRLELMLLSEDLFSALEESERLEKLTEVDAEARFAIAYAKAKAYKRLGQKNKATELLQSILQVRPTYRSASTLLAEIIEDRD